MTPLRRLGATDLETPPLMPGGNVFGWTADKQTSFAILDRFVDRGGCMIDTADVYSAWIDGHTGGESERVIGEWLRRTGRRDEVLIATKVGRSEEHTSELQSLMSISYAVFCLKKKKRRI